MAEDAGAPVQLSACALGCVAHASCSMSEAAACLKLPCSAAENCIVIAEGELDHRGIFRAAALGMPPVERREDSLAATKVPSPPLS